MDTGIGNAHLYTACRVKAAHYYEPNSKISSGGGTGFIVKLGGGRFALVTNRHIVDLPWVDAKYEGTYLAKLTVDAWLAGPDFPRYRIVLNPGGVRNHPDDSVDIAAIEMSSSSVGIEIDTPDAIGPGPLEVELNGSIDLGYLASSDDYASSVEAGEMLFLPGFPEWYDRNGDRPIMRTGTIVSDPRFDYRRTTGPVSNKDGNYQILFDAFSTSGNSGSPVYVAQRGFSMGQGLSYSGVFRPPRLVGINAGHFDVRLDESDGSSRLYHAGLSRMYKATAITELLQEM